MLEQDFGDGVEIARRQDATGRVLRGIENEQPRLGGDLRLELSRVERVISRLPQEYRHRHGAVGDDLRLVDRESRHRVDHFVADAMIGDRCDRVGDERLGARGNHDVVQVDIESAPHAQVARRGCAKFVDAGRGRVAVFAPANRGDRGILDVVRRREIRLADANRDDVPAAARQRIHFGQHDERVLGSKRVGAPR